MEDEQPTDKLIPQNPWNPSEQHNNVDYDESDSSCNDSSGEPTNPTTKKQPQPSNPSKPV